VGSFFLGTARCNSPVHVQSSLHACRHINPTALRNVDVYFYLCSVVFQAYIYSTVYKLQHVRPPKPHVYISNRMTKGAKSDHLPRIRAPTDERGTAELTDATTNFVKIYERKTHCSTVVSKRTHGAKCSDCTCCVINWTGSP
jgi:hypothetical protein